VATDGAAVSVEGNALIALSTSVGTVVGACTGSTAEYGPDGRFCTDDDPLSHSGTANLALLTTGSASGAVINPGDFDDVLGPVAVGGRTFACSASDNSVDISDGVISGVFTSCDQPTFRDIVAPITFGFGSVQRLPGRIESTPTPIPSTPTPSVAPCPGDCDNLGDVTVDELVTLVTVALGLESLDLCAMGDRNRDGRITVDEIIAATGRALDGC
jgi:hypothetical protein